MKKIYLLLLVVFVGLSLVVSPVPAMSADGGHGGGHSSGGHGGWGHGGGGHGGWGHGGRGHGGFRGGVWIGPGWDPWWDAWWWGPPYDYYPYYDGYTPYYDYAAPPFYVQQPQQYIQQAPQQEEQSYWYFCGYPQGYYPYVKKCSGGWMKVVPRSTPPDYESHGEPAQAPPDQRR
ncbi:MAG: hypothetical protein ACLQF0_09630 [Dissulfurispiraceae bacterium]